MKKYLDNDGLIDLYKIIMNKVDSKLSKAFDDYETGKLLPPVNRMLTFEALEDGTFSFVKTGAPTGSVSYSLDNGTTWTPLDYDTSTPTISAGSKVLWKGNYRKGDSYSNYAKFSSTGKFNASGNIMSLMYGDDFEDKTDLTGYNLCFYSLFKDCSNLVDASNLVLPATTLAGECYSGMFKGCTSLEVAPELPATTLRYYCYNNMFANCTSLVTAPELPATTLAQQCYYYMFNGCTSLKTAPELPVMTLTERCYSGMFKECTSLTTAPELPATTLVDGCYQYMFQGCTSLTAAPRILPAMTLISGCYYQMFQGCTSLTAAPELPATTLVRNCYYRMFYNCSKLNHIEAMFTTTPSASYTCNWVSGVSSTGTFVKNPDATWNVTGNNGVPTRWTVETPNYLSFEALEDGTFSFAKTGTPTGSISYSLDNGATWTSLDYGTSTPTVSAGSKILWKGNYRGLDSSNYAKFSSTGKFNASGNIMYLIFRSDVEGKTDLTGHDYCFYQLFDGCSNLVDTSNLVLPATTLAGECYSGMFKGCTSLEVAPELPATTLATSCYKNMFSNCTSLTAAPELPATTLASYCYQYMFQNCTSLTTAPQILPAMTLAERCYNYMFQGCTSLTTAPELPATTLMGYYCYSNMFQNCSKLNYIKAMFTTTSLASYTYNWVSGVSSTGTFVRNPRAAWMVTGADGIPTGWEIIGPEYLTFEALEDGTFSFVKLETPVGSVSYSLDNGTTWTPLDYDTSTPTISAGSKVLWKGNYRGLSDETFAYFSSTGKFNASGNVTSLIFGDDFKTKTNLTGHDNCFYKLFYNCSGLVDASNLILLATTLASKCYSDMFEGCTSLVTAPQTLPATTLASYCYYYMFNGCTSLVTAPKLPATSLKNYCYANMFYGCASLTTAPQILPATTLTERCYSGMFKGCTSLEVAPELPATTLTSYCYWYMFQNCSKLNYIKALFTTTPGSSYTKDWVNGVSSTGTFVKNPDATWNVTGNNGVPTRWTVETATA